MNKETFMRQHLEHLRSDPEVREYFARASEQQCLMLEQQLRNSLEISYDRGAARYFESGPGSLLARGLRLGGLVADGVGTYLFWRLDGSGFGFKGLGVCGKTLADIIDATRYEIYAHGLSYSRFKRLGMTAGECLAERAFAYLPLGVGELTDFWRGERKYANRVIADAVERAKKDFFRAKADS